VKDGVETLNIGASVPKDFKIRPAETLVIQQAKMQSSAPLVD